MSEFTLKIKLSGYKLCLFSLHPHTLELSIGHFQTLKDQGYQKFTQKIDDFDIAETPKMSVFEPKKPTVHSNKILSLNFVLTVVNCNNEEEHKKSDRSRSVFREKN